jgi:fluoroacetyl-CoA thioesterase
MKPGLEHELRFRVPDTKTVPALYPEAAEFQACIQAVKPHLDWPREQTVGTHIDVSHSAATPPGLLITVRTRLVEVAGRRLLFEVEAHDGVDLIGKGTHERYLIDRARFSAKAAAKSETPRAYMWRATRKNP